MALSFTNLKSCPSQRGWAGGSRWLSLLLGGLLALASCHPTQPPRTTPAPARVDEISVGAITCRISAEPAAVHLERDTLLTIQARAPATLEVQLPPLEGRLQGFILSGAYEREPQITAELVIREHCFKLTPILAEEYRLGPLAIGYVDRRQQPAQEGWFATHPMTFQVQPVSPDPAPTKLADILGPRRIFPPWPTVLGWVLVGLLVGGALGGVGWLGGRLRRNIKLKRLSPKERALRELTELIAQNLIATQQFKEFYLAITMIVRRYIERAHAIRAPEQTTEEFLAAVIQDARFSRAVVGKLRVFLQTADLVKFAAFQPDMPTVDQTLSTARDYLETDEWEQKQRASTHV
ncbi:MAG: hypothetical protein GX806_01185 [Lentisphaerae bacterium]|nr:hypothetical protein [Lentisphaerota bacterium]